MHVEGGLATFFVLKMPRTATMTSGSTTATLAVSLGRNTPLRHLSLLTHSLTRSCRSYHFEGSLPQYDVVCKERLVHPEDPANASAELSLQVATQVRFPYMLFVLACIY